MWKTDRLEKIMMKNRKPQGRAQRQKQKNWQGGWFLSILMLLSLALQGCGTETKVEQSYSDFREGFGTALIITLYGEDEAHLREMVDLAFEEMDRLEEIFSAKCTDSELAYVNEHAYQNPVIVSSELYELLEIALFYEERSDGALNISLGNLFELWGIGTENQRVPTEEELAVYRGLSGEEFVILDSETQSVSYTDERVKIDLGAIAKGYAADLVKELLLSKDESLYGILNFGGNIMTLNSKIDGAKWGIGITDPFDPSNACASIAIEDLCVVTSGNYERYFEVDGVRYHHILDPTTSYPASNGIVSSTIIGESSTVCDALSTSCFIMGVDQALEIIESTDGVEAVFIDEEGNFYFSSGIDQYQFQYL